MGQRAFQQRLKEIQMSPFDAKLYGQFYQGVSKQVLHSLSKSFQPI
jgi:hypothetical protein